MSTTKKKPELKTLPLKGIQVLGQFQSRFGGVDKARATQIGEGYRRQDPIPPVDVWHIVDEGHAYNDQYVLAGGFHRYAGREEQGYKDIPANVYTGTYAEALRHAAMANVEHDAAGLPRTNKDKARAVLLYCMSFKNLPQKDWPSNRDISETVRVSHQHVNNMDPLGRRTENEKGIVKDRSVEKNAARRSVASKAEVYDWKNLDEKFCYLAKALDMIADQHGIDSRKDPEFKRALAALDEFGDVMKIWSGRFGHKPTDTPEQYDAKAAAAKAAAKAAKAEKPKAAKKAETKPAKAAKGTKPPKKKPDHGVDNDGSPDSYEEPSDEALKATESDEYSLAGDETEK